MRKTLTKRILAMVTCLLLVFTTMPDIAVAAKELTAQVGTLYLEYEFINPCNSLTWPVGEPGQNHFLVAKRTGNKGLVIWTEYKLTDKGMLDMLDFISQVSESGFGNMVINDKPILYAFGNKQIPSETDCELKVTTIDGQTTADFTDTSDWSKFMYGSYIYTPIATTADIEATKELVGHDLSAGQFKFELLDGNDNVIGETWNTADGKIKFTVNCTEAKTFIYKVREVVDSATGYSYDGDVFIYTVRVDDNEGYLNATVVPPEDNDTTFNNSYTPVGTTADIEATKVLTGNSLSAGQFKFELLDGNGKVIKDTTNTADGKIKFTIDCSEVGTFTYKIREVSGNATGYSYDSDVFVYTVKVEDNAGNLKATVIPPEDMIFNNSYAPVGTTADIEATKVLTGNNLSAGQFKFELLDGSGKVIGETWNTADGRVKFTIKFSEAGTFTYKVREVNDGSIGYSYDGDVFIYTVKVEDNAGNLKATVTPPEDMTFNNSYAPVGTTADIEAIKVLTGNSLSAGQFKFELLDGSGKVIKDTTNTADGKIKFTVDFSEVGTFTYKVREVSGNATGYSYDGDVFVYTVKVEDNAGNLKATVTLPEDMTFNNSYTTIGTTADIEATKELIGHDISAGQFKFELLDGSGKAIKDTTNTADGKIKFTVDCSEVGTFTYKVREVSGNVTGYSYDGDVFIYTVKVEDNAGYLKATVISPEDTTFNNSYAPVGTTADIEATKVLTGNNLSAGQFKFELLDGSGNVIKNAANTADGKIKFTVDFSEVGTFTYKIREVSGNATGYSYDGDVFVYTVKVEDNAGNLKATVIPPEDMTFTNTYKPLSTTAKITANKELKGPDGNKMGLMGDQFKFQLKDEAGKEIGTVGNAADGSITFSAITYDNAGTYKYTVNEVVPEVEVEGYTYDKDVFNYEVVVSDDGGQLVATVHVPEDTTFNNSYELEDIPDDPTPLSSGGITASKVLEGKKLTKNQFQFQLRDEDGKLIETVYNTADGKIFFSPIEYKTAGTYIYKVNEVNAGEDGYTYDKSVFEYKVVIEEKDGHLVATVHVPEDTTFNNSYELEDIPDDPPPLTGDASNNGAYMMAALALCTAAFIISRKRKAGTNNR